MGKTYRREKSEGRTSRRSKKNRSSQTVKYKDEYLTEMYDEYDEAVREVNEWLDYHFDEDEDIL